MVITRPQKRKVKLGWRLQGVILFWFVDGEVIGQCCLAWRIPGTGEPGGLPSMGSQRVEHDWIDLAAAAAARCLTFSLKLPSSTWVGAPVLKGIVMHVWWVGTRILPQDSSATWLLFPCFCTYSLPLSAEVWIWVPENSGKVKEAEWRLYPTRI